jgi:phage protein D
MPSAQDLLDILTSIVRQTQVRILYTGKDITAQVAPDMLEFTYEESLAWEADNMTVQVQDSEVNGAMNGCWTEAKVCSA